MSKPGKERVYRAGYFAGLSGVRDDLNPWHINSHAWHEWARGWKAGASDRFKKRKKR